MLKTVKVLHKPIKIVLDRPHKVRFGRKDQQNKNATLLWLTRQSPCRKKKSGLRDTQNSANSNLFFASKERFAFHKLVFRLP